MSQPKEYGGMGLGTILTSAIFLAAIVAIVIYMTWTQGDREKAQAN